MNILYGISISGDAPDLPEFSAIRSAELPGSRLTEPGFSLPPVLRGKTIFIGNREDQRFFRTLPEAGTGVRQEFFRLCTRRGAAAAALNAEGFSLALDPEEADSLRPELGVICGIAEKYRLPLMLEIRIPGPAADPEVFYRLKHRLLYPARTLCALHPHEAGALEAAEKFAASCPFDCDLFRIGFDAAAGNYLSEKLWERLLKLVHPAGRRTPVVIFDPGPGADRSVYAELDRLAGLGART